MAVPITASMRTLDDRWRPAAHSHEPLPKATFEHEHAYAPIGAMLFEAPRKATLAASLTTTTSPSVQLQLSMAYAESDVAHLEAAQRRGQLQRARRLRPSLQRFVAQVPAQLAAVSPDAAMSLEPQVMAVVKRARAALDHTPNVSPVAHEAAERDADAHPTADIASELPSQRATQRPMTDLVDGEAAAGRPLPTSLRSELETALGEDLSTVRLHTCDASATAAESLNARAYATGQDIHFGAGQYDPSSVVGRHLIAHEVAHTVQQRGAAPSVQTMARVSTPGDAAELEAERFAHAFLGGGTTQGLVTAGMRPAATIHRFGRDEHAAIPTTHLIGLYDYLRTPEGKQWAKDHGYANPEDLIRRIEADPVVKTHNEPLAPGETNNHVAKLCGKSTKFTYGEPTALMGDLFGNWESLYRASETQRHHLMTEDSTASNDKYTNGEYLRLAANNDSHFATKNRLAWKTLHEQAIDIAKDAGHDDDAFNRALFIEASSGHFLTDAFSAGHQFEKGPLMAAVMKDLRDNPLHTENPAMQAYVAMVDMAGSTNVANLIVKAIHDRMNVEGFKVTNGKGMTWTTVGDGNLAKSPETQRIAALAVFESRQQIFKTRGAIDPPKTKEVEGFFPSLDTIKQANWQALGYIPAARKQVEQILYRERKEGRSKLGEVGGYLVEHNLEAIGDPLRERNILQQQELDRRGGGPGTAVGFQFQWRIGK